MGRFVFRLEAVLRLRAAKEEREISELAQLKRRAQEEEARFSQLMDLYEASQEETGGDWWERWLGSCYREALRREVRRAAQAVAEARQAEERQRENVLSARKERLTVEKLKERRYAAFLAEEALKESRLLDEVGCLSFNHRFQEERR
ncbi:flagellar export protein FliJ [Ammonifex degensii KC4]|uniref:Flagellar FliJ protein n=1 Tax=Ammonifex degensii (strain DSM 10501 / KC4) TaxID=429009 RepID=C9R9Y9_AMMDK|nr:flagellar FliJ family protein [Ammonifex degensii]ACX53118.1 flagellar export protein FliJ [Ammonifex degensii KC4]